MWPLSNVSFKNCEFYETWDFENMNFVKNDTMKMWILSKNMALKMWILSKLRFWKCEFCEKWDFENVNFEKNEILKVWFLWKMRFWKCEFMDKLRIFAPVWPKYFLGCNRIYYETNLLIILPERMTIIEHLMTHDDEESAWVNEPSFDI